MEDMINETAVDTEIIDTHEDGYDSQEDVSSMGLGSMVLPFGAGIAVGAIVVKVVVPVVCDVAEKVTTGRVVAIARRNWKQYCGSIEPIAEGTINSYVISRGSRET